MSTPPVPDFAADPDGWIAASARRTRAEQGLPPAVTDPVVLARVADMLRPWWQQQYSRTGRTAA